MTKKKMGEYMQFIEEHTIELDASYRGGTLKVDVSSLFPAVDNAIMGAYQNYLGGGMAGAVVGAAMFDPDNLSKRDQTVFYDLKEAIKQYFFAITNEENSDEWAQSDFTSNQARNVSAY